MASNKNKWECLLFHNVAMITGITEIIWQVTSCGEIFNGGSHPPIHGRITTSHADCDTAGPGSGSFNGTPSRNGRHPDQVPFCGYMANVSCRPTLTLLQRL